ncbi:MAG TPA: NAD(P)-dependent oxidoreductase [Stellaceae bacterium]|nr:NAD(P)-dependent oxidoreductase [Stellaceae bacterium]
MAEHRIGWIGAGRMGFAIAERLLKAGKKLAVYNRTRAKAEPLAERGARVVDGIAELADCDIVFVIVAESKDLLEVISGPKGLLSRPGHAPRIVIDSSTVSESSSAEARAKLAERGAAFLCAPVSGNPKVVRAGKLSVVVSGPQQAYNEVAPYLQIFGRGVSYVGEGERARIVKICHNVYLGIVAQALAEITVLAEKNGVPRHAFLSFINDSVMGSTFSRYKTPAYVNLDFAATFTPPLLRKDLDLGLEAAHELGVPMPIAAATREIVQTLIGHGYTDCDFAALVELEAKGAGLELVPENVKVSDGLEPQG